ncbi:MAG: MerR family transcriptional regulator, partial [Chitinophagaceae bacterium]
MNDYSLPERPAEADFLSVKEAAEYIGVAPQTLRRWDEADKLRPIRHAANGYRYYRRADLEPFRLQYRQAQQAVN